VPKTEGVQVRQGDVIFRLNDAAIRKEYELAEHDADATFEVEFATVALEKAQEDLRIKLDANQGGTPVFSESEIRKQQLEVDHAEAGLKKAIHDQKGRAIDRDAKKVRLDQTVVRSTLDGMVTQINRLAGESVSPGDAIVTITDMSVLRATLVVNYSWYSDIHVGDKVEIYVAQPARSGERGAADSPARATGSAPGILDKLPGRPAPSATPNDGTATSRPGASTTATAATPGNLHEGMRFDGTVTHILPVLEDGGSGGKQLQIFASIPNRKDESGHDLLLQGVQVLEAWIIPAGSR
ncbi:MAG: HlyD family efflux transporter periplasmic adaptor subunit, partial [Planctomycetaceae bacterium]|nr:HlyD family efflux transporter periplasmic adaptor subunit [Planctomycetaceae bacterium]